MRPLVRTLLFAAALPATSPCWAQSPPSEFSEHVGKKVTSVLIPIWSTGNETPIERGKVLTLEDIRVSERNLRAALAQRRASDPIPPRLDIAFASTEVRPKGDGVEVDFSVKEIVITDQDSLGRAIDESAFWYTSSSRDFPQFNTRYIQNPSLGPALAVDFALPRIVSPLSASSRSLIVPSIGASAALDGDFWGVNYGVQVIPGLSERARRFSCNERINVAQLPFADGHLRTLNVRLGCDYRFASETLEEWRGSASYRLSRDQIGPVGPTLVENGFELDARREILVSPGFIRVAPWIDGAFSSDSGRYLRIGGLSRSYLEWFGKQDGEKSRAPQLVLEVLFSAARGIGQLPINRRFVGGAKLADQLLDAPFRPEDYWLSGPVLRGYGTGQFHGSMRETANDTGFASIGVTIGLPGLSKLLFARELRSPEYRQQLERIEAELTATTVARAFAESLETESTVEAARKRTDERLTETKKIFSYFLRHAKSDAVRPVLAFDYAWLTQRPDPLLRDWSAGFGVRVATGGGALVNALYMWNGGAMSNESRSGIVIQYQRVWDRSDF